MENYTIGQRFGMECGPVGFGRDFNPSVGPASEFLLRTWVSPRCASQPRFLQAPPMYMPCCPEQGPSMPCAGYESPFAFGNPLQDMAPPEPPQPPLTDPSSSPFQTLGPNTAIPSMVRSSRGPTKPALWTALPSPPYTGFQQDQYHTEMLSRLSQNAAGRLMEESRSASPREFQPCSKTRVASKTT